MNVTEIKTLLLNGVEPGTIAVACAAGDLHAVLRRATLKVAQARAEHDGVEWREILRVLEPVVREEEKMAECRAEVKRSKRHDDY